MEAEVSGIDLRQLAVDLSQRVLIRGVTTPRGGLTHLDVISGSRFPCPGRSHMLLRVRYASSWPTTVAEQTPLCLSWQSWSTPAAYFLGLVDVLAELSEHVPEFATPEPAMFICDNEVGWVPSLYPHLLRLEGLLESRISRGMPLAEYDHLVACAHRLTRYIQTIDPITLYNLARDPACS